MAALCLHFVPLAVYGCGILLEIAAVDNFEMAGAVAVVLIRGRNEGRGSIDAVDLGDG